jgi:hypothetical protein
MMVMPGIAVRRTASLPLAYVPAMTTGFQSFSGFDGIKAGLQVLI